jgi:hypothetical protein
MKTQISNWPEVINRCLYAGYRNNTLSLYKVPVYEISAWGGGEITELEPSPHGVPRTSVRVTSTSTSTFTGNRTA